MNLKLFSRLPRKVQDVYIFLLKRNRGQYWSKELREIFEKHYGVSVGIGSYGCFNAWAFQAGTTIGSYCSFAAGAWSANANHPLGNPSTHPLFYSKGLGCDVEHPPLRNLVVGSDVWIGRNAFITASCSTIGNGAVIGANSVVTHDVPPYAIVAGSPARVIRYRFSPAVIQAVEESQWWTWEESYLREHAGAFQSMEKFLDFIGKSEALAEGDDKDAAVRTS